MQAPKPTLRREDRHALSAKIRLTWQDARGAPHFGFGQGINISPSGLAALFEEEIPLGALVGFEIPRMKLRGSGSMRYTRRKGMRQIIGLEFVGGCVWNPHVNPLPGG